MLLLWAVSEEIKLLTHHQAPLQNWLLLLIGFCQHILYLLPVVNM